MLRARIGVARRVHRIVRYSRLRPGIWGVAACGWAGMVDVVDPETTDMARCPLCRDCERSGASETTEELWNSRG
jgi:hypothetical protein